MNASARSNRSSRVESLKASRVIADAAISKADRHFVTALSRGLELLAKCRIGQVQEFIARRLAAVAMQN